MSFHCIKLSPLCQYFEKFLHPDCVIGIFTVPVCVLSCENLIAMSYFNILLCLHGHSEHNELVLEISHRIYCK